jgi:lysophospholipase L1-like esterase
MRKRYGTRVVMMSLFPMLLLLFIAYQVDKHMYYSRREYLFDPYLQLQKAVIDTNSVDKAAINILCLGGSTTYGHNLPDGSKYPELLEKSLRAAYPDKSIKVYNVGRPWYTSKHSLINYVTDYRRIKPDVVIVMEAINDIYRSFSPDDLAVGDFKEDYSHYYGPAINGAKPPTYLTDKFNKYGHLTKRLWNVLFGEKVTREDYDISRYVSIHSYRYNLSTLIESVKSDGRACIVLEQPFYYHDGYKEWEYKEYDFFSPLTMTNGKSASIASLKMAMERFNETASEVAKLQEVMFIRTRAALPSDTTVFMDDVHQTKKGARLFAEEVSKRIVESGVLLNLRK